MILPSGPSQLNLDTNYETLREFIIGQVTRFGAKEDSKTQNAIDSGGVAPMEIGNVGEEYGEAAWEETGDPEEDDELECYWTSGGRWTFRPGPGKGKAKGKGKGQSKGQSESTVCWSCGQRGHTRAQCPLHQPAAAAPYPMKGKGKGKSKSRTKGVYEMDSPQEPWIMMLSTKGSEWPTPQQASKAKSRRSRRSRYGHSIAAAGANKIEYPDLDKASHGALRLDQRRCRDTMDKHRRKRSLLVKSRRNL